MLSYDGITIVSLVVAAINYIYWLLGVIENLILNANGVGITVGNC